MKLEELISALTNAQELASEGKWESVEDRVHDLRHIVCCSCVHSNAQAIAIQHNTAEEVLQALKRLDEAETKARVCREDADTNAARAEKAEAKVAELETST